MGWGGWPPDGQGPAQEPSLAHGAMGGPWGRGAQTSDSAAHPPVPSAISSILGTWLDQYSEDFCQPPDFPCLKQLVAYVQLNMPGSDLERRAHLLLAQLEHSEPTEAEPEGEEDWGGCQRLNEAAAPGSGAGPGAQMSSDHTGRDHRWEGSLVQVLWVRGERLLWKPGLFSVFEKAQEGLEYF